MAFHPIDFIRADAVIALVKVLTYILLCLIWGSAWIAIKIGLTEAPPLTTAAIRFTLSALILAAIALARGYKYPSSLKSLARLGYPGIFMYGLSYALVYFAEQYIDSGLAAVLFGAYPFFVAILTWVKYQNEKLGAVAWLGMVIGFVGVVLISFDSLQTSGDLFLGVLLAVGAPLAAAWGIVIHKQHYSGENIVVAVNVQMIFGGIPLILAAALFENWRDFNVSLESVGSILYLAIFGTVVTFLSYYWLLRHMRLTTVSLIAFVTPMVAIFIGVLFADEKMTPLIMLGTSLILSGVFLVVRRSAAVPQKS